MRPPRAYRDLYRAAIQQGWTVTVTGGGHLCWKSPSGAKVWSSNTPNGSDSRAHRNQLRKAGLKGV